jgi:hypothetical protein
MAPWWWFLREPKHVGATVGIFNRFNIPVILSLCASLWDNKSALILLMHGTNMKIGLLELTPYIPAKSQWWRRLIRILSNSGGCLITLQSATTLKTTNFLRQLNSVIIKKIYSWNIPGVFVLTSLEFKFVNVFQKNHSVSQYKVQVNILTNTCTKWNTIKQQNHKIQFMVSTLRCFGTGVVSLGSLLKHRNTSTDRQRYRYENIQILKF